MTDNTMARRKSTKGQTMPPQLLIRKSVWNASHMTLDKDIESE